MSIPIWLLSLITGIIVGLVFGVFKLPIPAPVNIAGILGVVGIYIGWKLATFLLSLI